MKTLLVICLAAAALLAACSAAGAEPTAPVAPAVPECAKTAAVRTMAVPMLNEPDPGIFNGVEAWAVKPLAPNMNSPIGAGVALRLGTIPESWWVVGRWLGSRDVFAAVIAGVDGPPSYGGGISLTRHEEDQGLRFYVARGGCEWSSGLAYAKGFSW